jgi:hypothetical protein
MPPRLRSLLLPALLTGSRLALAEADIDYHFRAFWVEPADRMELGQGHLVAGINHETRPNTDPRQRTSLPMEATLGLGAGFGLVLGMEGSAAATLQDGSSTAAAHREARLRYSFPEWRGVHTLLMVGTSQFTGDDAPRFSQGYAIALDTDAGTLGFGQTWGREHAADLQRPQETGLNFFKVGLGSDGRWAAGTELRWENSGAGLQSRHWLLGVGRILRKGLMADVAVGGSSGDDSARRITAGLSFFF